MFLQYSLNLFLYVVNDVINRMTSDGISTDTICYRCLAVLLLDSISFDYD